MSAQRRVGPLQLLLVGFETTERFRGDIVHELKSLRGRGHLRVLDARMFQRTPEGALTEIDLNPVLADPPEEQANPVARLLGVNGGGGNGGMSPREAFAHTTGFATEDLRRLMDQIGPGHLAVALLVEHVWAAHLHDAIHEAGGTVLGQGLLTSEVTMIVGDELQARADAEAAIELAHAARGAALLEALATLAEREAGTPENRPAAAAEVVRILVERGFVHDTEATGAVDALVTAGLLESATFEAALVEAEDLLARSEPPPGGDV
jgi:hypothetical protein